MTKLGQNFLISKPIARRMANSAEIKKNDTVLEIGPGRGILTEELLKRAKKVIAVEKDFELFNFLSQKFSETIKLKKLVLLNADIRDVLKNHKRYTLNPKCLKVVANIPYYLTGQLLRLLLEPKPKRYALNPERLVLMVQKEVAQRITANLNGKSRALAKMNILAVSVRVFSEPKIAFYVSRRNFRPEPKVDSAVIILKKREKDFFRERKISQKAFFELVKAGFAHKRKLLTSNLKPHTPNAKRCFTECKITQNARAEDLSLENWACIAKNISDIHRKK